jgi:hypothetical protein
MTTSDLLRTGASPVRANHSPDTFECGEQSGRSQMEKSGRNQFHAINSNRSKVLRFLKLFEDFLHDCRRPKRATFITRSKLGRCGSSLPNRYNRPWNRRTMPTDFQTSWWCRC